MKEEFEIKIEQLRKKEVDSYLVKKEHLLDFRAVIIVQEDTNDFRGIAKHQGDTVFTFEPGWTKQQ